MAVEGGEGAGGRNWRKRIWAATGARYQKENSRKAWKRWLIGWNKCPNEKEKKMKEKREKERKG